ncbi:MAG: dihydropteroate synthase [Candidatus Marinimicrobia bacterium]|nr:dihydropteroate synthase [Candidatus Neomarinimicrobiota bacterium]
MYKLSDDIQIMGILNLTPDSFYSEIEISLEMRLTKLLSADIIDVGAESSQPGAKPITSEEEIRRIETLLPLLSKGITPKISIDTYKPKTACFALKNGFNIVNDITGGKSSELLNVVADYNAEIILMHMQGSPVNMQNNPKYDDVIEDIISFFELRCERAIKAGISQDKIIIDPGIGFGKSINDNDKIVSNISKFKSLGFPVLIGLSRKSFLQYNDDLPSDRLATTISTNTLSMLNGADIIRVHDVEEHIKARAVLSRMSSQYSGEFYGC